MLIFVEKSLETGGNYREINTFREIERISLFRFRARIDEMKIR